MSVEAVVSLGAAWMARSPPLLGFGGDSGVELLSAAVVLWRLYSPSRGEHSEQLAARRKKKYADSLATFLGAANVNPSVIQKMLRHAKSQTTARYIHAVNDKQLEAQGLFLRAIRHGKKRTGVLRGNRSRVESRVGVSGVTSGNSLKRMAGTTRLELATSAVTV
jgi:hypothetical protein